MMRSLIYSAVLTLSCASSAHAQVYRADPADRLALARMCVHEAGWLSLDDCDAIYAVLMWKATRLGISIADMAKRYGPMVFDETRTDPEAWKVFLTDGDQPPKMWPAKLKWHRHIRWWRRILRRADDLLTGHHIAQCVADHWGARRGVNEARARARGWIVVDCGPTRNIFYLTPPRQRRR